MDDAAMIGGVADKARMEAGQAKLRAANLRTQKAMTPEQADKAAEEFEAVFLSQMLEHMFAETDMMPMSEGPGEDIYKSMLIDEYGKIIARTGGIGVADHVKREMLKMQEVQEVPNGN